MRLEVGVALPKTDPGDIVAIPSIKAGVKVSLLSRVIAPEPYGLTEVFSEFFTDFGITEERVLEQDFSKENRLFAPVYASMDFSKWVGK